MRRTLQKTLCGNGSFRFRAQFSRFAGHYKIAIPERNATSRDACASEWDRGVILRKTGRGEWFKPGVEAEFETSLRVKAAILELA
jgi:hypothetical protein